MSVFSNLKGYILCWEKGHMGFFHNSWSTVWVASKIKKKKTCDHNDDLSNGSLKTKQNTIFMLFWGSITQQQVFLHVNLFWLKRYTITVDMILIHRKKNFARAQRRVWTQYFHTLPPYPKTWEKFCRKVKNAFDTPKCVLSEIPIKPMWPWCIKEKK